MCSDRLHRWARLCTCTVLFLTAAPGPDAGLLLYWCPHRPPDQRLAASPGPGCEPFVEKPKEPDGAQKKDPGRNAEAPRPSIKADELESETRRFLHDYRGFLSCCTLNPETLEELEDLEERASALLKAADTGLFSEQMKLRGFTLRELIAPIAQARLQLRTLKKRWKSLAESKERLQELDFEAAGRERLQIEEAEESLREQLQLKSPPDSPPTGMEIGTTPSMGPQIGIVPPTGPSIGHAPTTGAHIGVTPPTGPDEIGQAPPTGFEIGTTGRVGPEIGDSSLNQR